MKNEKVIGVEKEAQQNAGEFINVPVIEEQLQVATKLVERGYVTITKNVVHEDAIINQALNHEEVIIEKKEINQYVNAIPPAVRQEGDKTIISVFKEVAVVEKKIMLVEEIHITKRTINTNVAVRESIRKENVVINRTNNL